MPVILPVNFVSEQRKRKKNNNPLFQRSFKNFGSNFGKYSCSKIFYSELSKNLLGFFFLEKTAHFSASFSICPGGSGCSVPRCPLLLVSASFSLLPRFCFFQRGCGCSFLLLLLEAAQRVGVALFPLPLPAPALSVLAADALLLFHALDALLLSRAHQLSHLDGLDMTEGRLAGLVQHNGVEDDVKQRNTWNLLQACSHRMIL